MPETIAFWRGRLPHWEVEDGRYFVTIHLAGEIPREASDRIHAMVAGLEKSDPDARLKVQRLVFKEMEAWLDRTGTSRHLHDSRVAQMVTDAIAFRGQQRTWHVFEYVIMPNHLHLFFQMIEGRLKAVLEGFKRWTARRAAEVLSVDGGPFWQREWFDHWSRSDEEDEKIINYIRHNPVKAGLVKHFTQWPYGSW